MPINDKAPKPREGEIQIVASQLRPGVHVRLPVTWLEHQFMFNSFVIEDEDQARQIAAMNLPQIFCDVTRCKVPPLPKPVISVPPDPISEEEKARLNALASMQMEEKLARTKVMSARRERLDKAQKHYAGASNAIGSAFKSFDANPKESVKQIAKVSEESTAVLLADPDSAIVLIAEKGATSGQAAHALSVMTLALLLGKQARLPEEALHALGVGALLHDIGKSAISPSILRNNERNKHEEAVYRTHCLGGYESALSAGSLSQPILDTILHHHERLDGSGFPDGLHGEGVHLAARVVAIADRFDNLVNPIDFRHAISPSEALARMWSKEKNGFDATLLQLFIRAMGVYPPGSIVQLSDGHVGVVMTSATTESPLSPQVIIYDPEVPLRQAFIIDLAKEPSVKIDRALRLHDRPNEELDYLLPRRKMNWFPMEGQP